MLQEKTEASHNFPKFSLTNIISLGGQLRKPSKDLPLSFAGEGVSMSLLNSILCDIEFLKICYFLKNFLRILYS